MRRLSITLLAVALAVPVVALADRGPEDRAASSVKQSAVKRKQQKHLRQARSAARAKSIAAARSAGATVTPRGELELEGVLTSLSPLAVGTVSCAVPAGVSLAGFAVGDFVELECRLVAGVWTLRELELEDDHARTGNGTSLDDHDDDDRGGYHDDDDDDRAGHHDDDHDDDD